MPKTRSPQGRWLQRRLWVLEVAFALALLFLYSSPWVSSMGAQIPAYDLAERLEGMHRLAGLFSKRSQISEAYELARHAVWLPTLAIMAILLGPLASLASRNRWASRLAGAADIAAGMAVLFAVHHVKVFLEGKWFHHLEYGATWSVYPAAGMVLLGGLRWVAGR